MERVAGRRTSDLLVEELGDELVIYDTRTKRAHHLNRASAAIWQACDSKSSLAAVAERASAILGEPVSTQSAEVAVSDFEVAGLLESGPTLAGMSRRTLIKRAAIAAAAIPVLTTITAPPAAAQTSTTCLPKNAVCTAATEATCCSKKCTGINPQTLNGKCQ